MLEGREQFKIRQTRQGLEFELWSGPLHSYQFHTYEEVQFWGDKKFIVGAIEKHLRDDLRKIKYLHEFGENNRKLGKKEKKAYEKVVARNIRKEPEPRGPVDKNGWDI